MIKRLIAAGMMSALMAGSAWAQQQGAGEAGKCMQAAYDLANAAEQKQLPNERQDKVEDLLNKMEDLCDAERVPEAMALAKDIEAEINAQ